MTSSAVETQCVHIAPPHGIVVTVHDIQIGVRVHGSHRLRSAELEGMGVAETDSETS